MLTTQGPGPRPGENVFVSSLLRTVARKFPGKGVMSVMSFSQSQVAMNFDGFAGLLLRC